MQITIQITYDINGIIKKDPLRNAIQSDDTDHFMKSTKLITIKPKKR